MPVGPSANRRPEDEPTHALLLINCHLEHGKGWPTARRISCLTAIVIGVQGLREDLMIVAARVRDRLRQARKVTSLQIGKSDYLDALSIVGVTDTMQETQERQQLFAELILTLCSSEHAESLKEEVAARLGPSFRVS